MLQWDNWFLYNYTILRALSVESQHSSCLHRDLIVVETTMGTLEILTLLSVILALLLYFVKRKFSYWKDMGVPFEKPVFPFGNIKGTGRDFHLSMIMTRLYEKLKSHGTPFSGMFFFFSPVALVTSLDFAKTVLVKDAASFTNRGIYYNEEDGGN